MNSKHDLAVELIEDFLQNLRGINAESSGSCQMGAGKEGEGHEASFMDRRLAHWRSYLETRKKINEAILRNTGKSKDDSILNTGERFYRDQLANELLKVGHQGGHGDGCIVKGEATCDATLEFFKDVLDVPLDQPMPTTYPCTVVDGLPKISQKEQAIKVGCKELLRKDDCPVGLITALRNVGCNVQKLQKMLPKTEQLEVVGRPLDAEEECSECALKVESGQTTFDIEISHSNQNMSPPKEDQLESTPSMILINGKKVETGFASESVTFDTTARKMEITEIFEIRNSSWNLLNFKWTFVGGGEDATDLRQSIPVFHFSKKPFMLHPGQFRKPSIYFYSSRPGIYEEHWLIEGINISTKVSVYLFAVVNDHDDDEKKFERMRLAIEDKVVEDMANELLKNYMVPPFFASAQSFDSGTNHLEIAEEELNSYEYLVRRKDHEYREQLVRNLLISVFERIEEIITKFMEISARNRRSSYGEDEFDSERCCKIFAVGLNLKDTPSKPSASQEPIQGSKDCAADTESVSDREIHLGEELQKMDYESSISCSTRTPRLGLVSGEESSGLSTSATIPNGRQRKQDQMDLDLSALYVMVYEILAEASEDVAGIMEGNRSWEC